MKQRRLKFLLILLTLVGLARWLAPPQDRKSTPVALVSAVVRPAPILSSVSAALETLAISSQAPEAEEDQPVGNAFTVRSPPPPPPQPVQNALAAVPIDSPKIVVVPTPTLSAEQPTAASVPPLQVIGTWRDQEGFAAFVSTPSGTLIARPGTVVVSDYSVTAVTPQVLSLRQISSHRDLQIPVPRPPGL